jgi:ribosomal protein S18 acetylase RimI-like enzyme
MDMQDGAPLGEWTVRATGKADRTRLGERIAEAWGAEIVVARGQVFRPAELPGFLAEDRGGHLLGLLTYHLSASGCEIVTLNSWREGSGIGTALLTAVHRQAIQSGCRRLFLMTTNDNLHALAFYQKRGFFIRAVRLNAVAASRRIKPQIPTCGDSGLPIRDEIDLEMHLP